jgi:molybdopterin-binding protein
LIEEEDGVTSIAQVTANAVMIKAENGQLTIEGADDNTNISVYTIDGVQVGSSISRNGIAHVNTNFIRDSIAIVKIGSRNIKVIMK